jgi:hypothetical protein
MTISILSFLFAPLSKLPLSAAGEERDGKRSKARVSLRHLPQNTSCNFKLNH